MKISIITVVLNDAAGLDKTIQSIITQTWNDKELIVIDGGSNDGTVSVIQKHSLQISGWTSEPDQGIYTAMNKGMNYAKGEWLIFLNAGDTFAGDEAISMAMQNDIRGADVLYGDSIADYGRFQVYRKALKISDLWRGMICSHQSMLFRRKLFEKKKYRTDFDIVADHELICSLYKEGFSFHYLQNPLVIWDTHGLSNHKQVKSVSERYKMVKQFFDYSFYKNCYYFFLLILAVCVQVSYAVLPEKWVWFVIRNTHRENLISSSSTR